MRLANCGGRAALVDEAGARALDLHENSGGRFAADPMAAFAQWSEVRAFAESAPWQKAADLDAAQLGPCVPRPPNIYGIGLNYRDHAAEAGLEVPKTPMVFAKFRGCLAGPRADIPLSGDTMDWEAELVVAIGRRARRVAAADAYRYVAGCCVGQDVSDRRMQMKDAPPQFSLAKSLPGFGPVGPWLTSLDAASDPDDLEIKCSVAGEEMQHSRTSGMVFSVPELVAYLSTHLVLLPGDLIFTGTPAGVGTGKRPRRFLAAGELIETEIEGLGRLANRCVAAG